MPALSSLRHRAGNAAHGCAQAGLAGPRAQSSMGAKLPAAGLGSDTPSFLSVGDNDSEVSRRDAGYSSGQPGRENIRHQIDVQSLEIGIMAREKHF